MNDALVFRERYGPAALVTGASSGIGKAFAEALAARGLELFLVARRMDRLETIAHDLTQQHGVRVTPIELDLARSEAAAQLALTTAVANVGLIVSNAGFSMKGDHADNDPELMT